jgi:hypothetical protein
MWPYWDRDAFYVEQKRTQQTGLGDTAFSGSPIDIPLKCRAQMEWRSIQVSLLESRKGVQQQDMVKRTTNMCFNPPVK